MKFLIFILLMCFPYSLLLGGECMDLESLRKSQNTIEGALHKVARHNYIGEARLSGVLVWRRGFIQDSDGWEFRELVFYPDKNPLFDEDTYFTLYRDDIAKFHHSTQRTSDKLKLSLGKDWKEKYALSDMMAKVELVIFNHQHIDTDFIESGIDFVDFKDLILKSDIKQCFFEKDTLSSLSYVSKDSYINLRESTNGKILRMITKNEIKQY